MASYRLAAQDFYFFIWRSDRFQNLVLLMKLPHSFLIRL